MTNQRKGTGAPSRKPVRDTNGVSRNPIRGAITPPPSYGGQAGAAATKTRKNRGASPALRQRGGQKSHCI